MNSNEKSREQRAQAVAEKVWQQWTHQGADVFNDQQNAAIKGAIATAVAASDVEGISDEDWLADAMAKLPATPPIPENGGTPA